MGWLRKILRVEPGVALGWWIAERIWSVASNWTFIWGIVGGLAMTYWSAISSWAEPAVVGGLGIGTALVTMLVIARVRLWNARRAVEKANERYVDARASSSSVNPLAAVFTNERIDLRDLTRPLTNHVMRKSFIGCQIVGPVNVTLSGDTNMANPNGIACEAVYVDNEVPVSNVIHLVDCDFRNCEFFNVTFMVPGYQFTHFCQQISTSWITTNPNNYARFVDGEMTFRVPAEQTPELPFRIEQQPVLDQQQIAE